MFPRNCFLRPVLAERGGPDNRDRRPMGTVQIYPQVVYDVPARCLRKRV